MHHIACGIRSRSPKLLVPSAGPIGHPTILRAPCLRASPFNKANALARAIKSHVTPHHVFLRVRYPTSPSFGIGRFPIRITTRTVSVAPQFLCPSVRRHDCYQQSRWRAEHRERGPNRPPVPVAAAGQEALCQTSAHGRRRDQLEAAAGKSVDLHTSKASILTTFISALMPFRCRNGNRSTPSGPTSRRPRTPAGP